jgi:hypothetical protein
MADNDWAVVVGIQDYPDPDLAGLEGPENDAKEFYDWVVDPNGGAVPKDQAALVLSSNFHPPFKSLADAMPTAEKVKEAFDHLRAVAEENAVKGNGLVVGERLYLFFAGHGFAPSHRDDLTALLTADASVTGQKLSHVIGATLADWFWRARYFEQILLFMDCCRSIMECAQLFEPYPDRRGNNYYEVKRFYGYGARVAKESREWKTEDGKSHGVFTRTLVDALRGAGYDKNDPTKITAESLRDQLYNAFKDYMAPADRKRPDLPKEPEVVYEGSPTSNFTIVTRQPVPGALAKPKFAVRISAGAKAGQEAVIVDKNLAEVARQMLAAETDLQLERGIFGIQVNGKTAALFEVTGAPGGTHVQL